MNSEIKIQVPKRAFNVVYLPFLDADSRYLALCGGAGSGKSDFAVGRYLLKLLQRPICNLLVARAVGKTNRDSTFALFKQIINRWGLTAYFRIHESDLRIRCRLNHNEIIFRGLDDTEKLKSVTFAHGELTDVWIEEASEVQESDFNQLDIRLRGKGTKKQITLSFNPVDANHWLKKRFFDNKLENAAVLHTTYKDNRFLDEDYKALLESYRDTDPYYYQVYCLGEWGVLGKTIFDAQRVNERLAEIRDRACRAGYFRYDENPAGLSGIRFEDDPNGCIRIYREPKPGYPYVIGGDTSGDGSDYFVGQVLDNTDGEQVCTLRHGFDEDVYARQMYCLGRYYNDALLGVEVNYSTYPIKELQRLGYPRQYRRETVDKITNKALYKYGFVTNARTRPELIAALVKLVREQAGLLNDKDTLDEMLTFVRSEKGRPEAQNGAHDDCILALGIAHAIRGQQRDSPTLQPRRKDTAISDFLSFGG